MEQSFDAAAGKCLVAAGKAARELGSSVIGTDHLLLAIVRVFPPASDSLAHLTATEDVIRRVATEIGEKDTLHQRRRSDSDLAADSRLLISGIVYRALQLAYDNHTALDNRPVISVSDLFNGFIDLLESYDGKVLLSADKETRGLYILRQHLFIDSRILRGSFHKALARSEAVASAS